MTRSERLFEENKVDIHLDGLADETVDIIDEEVLANTDCRYIATDMDGLCNNRKCSIDVYERSDGKLLGLVNYEQERMYAKVTLFADNYRDNTEQAYWEGLVAYLGEETHEFPCVRLMALENGRQLCDTDECGRTIRASYGILCDKSKCDIYELLPATPEMDALYQDTINSIKVTVSYRDYDETLDNWGSAQRIKGTDHEEVLRDIHSVKDGEKWMLENHPAQYMGCCISATNGDLHALALPCSEYPKGRYETRAGRELYAKERAEALGVQVGRFDYSLADKQLKKNHDFER